MIAGKKIETFRDLIVWQESRKLAVKIYQATKFFPKEEVFCLVSQMRRAVVSVASNIAEGFGRPTGKDRVKFYWIAKGSLLELESQVLIAESIGYLTQEDRKQLEENIWTTSKLLAGLIKKTRI